MPAVIKTYIENQENALVAFENVRSKQLDLITAYQADIAKHAGKINAMHIDKVWHDIPAQLARAQDGHSQKFKFKGIISGIDRYQRLADTIDWLCAGTHELYCWEEGRSEVEFLQILDGHIIPIEVKSGHVTKAQSLQKFSKKYAPPYQIILSAKPMQSNKGTTRYYPLYLASRLIYTHSAVRL